MLGKLLKYDFRAMWKQFSIVWPAVLIIALFNRFTLPIHHHSHWLNSNTVIGAIAISLFFSGIFAMFVVSMVFVLTRFYKGLLGDEGYLMHTLPVKTWQLLLSKLICAVVVTLMNIVVAGLSVCLIVPIQWWELLRWGTWKILIERLIDQPDIPLLIAEVLLMMFTSLILTIMTMYISMAIGHLFHRHRIILSVVAYFIIYTVGSSLISIFFNWSVDTILSGNTHLMLWTSIGGSTALSCVMFFVTNYILEHRLNLE